MQNTETRKLNCILLIKRISTKSVWEFQFVSELYERKIPLTIPKQVLILSVWSSVQDLSWCNNCLFLVFLVLPFRPILSSLECKHHVSILSASKKELNHIRRATNQNKGIESKTKNKQRNTIVESHPQNNQSHGGDQKKLVIHSFQSLIWPLIFFCESNYFLKFFLDPVTCMYLCVWCSIMYLASTLLLEIPKKIMIRSEGSESISNIMLMYYGNPPPKKNYEQVS